MKPWHILVIAAVIVGLTVAYFWADYRAKKDYEVCMANPELISQTGKVRDLLGQIYDGVEINTNSMDDNSRSHLSLLKMMVDDYKSTTTIKDASKGLVMMAYSFGWQKNVCEKHLIIPNF